MTDTVKDNDLEDLFGKARLPKSMEQLGHTAPIDLST